MASHSPILKPRPLDILSGKDKLCVAHEGSKRFRAVVETYRHRYSLSKTKYQKMMITKEIYESLNGESCRFLKYNSDTKTWEELSPMAARDKVGHALRFANRKNKRQPRKKDDSSKNKETTKPDSPSVVQLPEQPVKGSEDRHRHKHTVTPIDYEESYSMDIDGSYYLEGIPEVPSQESSSDDGSQGDGIWPTSSREWPKPVREPAPMRAMPPLPRMDYPPKRSSMPPASQSYTDREFDYYRYAPSPVQTTAINAVAEHHRTVSLYNRTTPIVSQQQSDYRCHSQHDHQQEQPQQPDDVAMASLMEQFSEDWDPNLNISPDIFS